MTITLYLEIKGRIKDKQEIDFSDKEQIAKMWRDMSAGKKVMIYYTLESKINYGPDAEQDHAADGGR